MVVQFELLQDQNVYAIGICKQNLAHERNSPSSTSPHDMATSRKTFLITGASSGLGLALALCALRHGHRVIGTARKPDVAAKTHPDYEKLGGKWVRLDVSVPGAAQAISKIMIGEQDHRAEMNPGPIEWVIIPNAGYAMQGTIEDQDEAAIEHHLQTNLWGTIRVLKAAIPILRQNRCGTIMSMSSIFGFAAVAESQIYAATKFATEAVVESYASLLAPLGIKCVIIEPGIFRTNLALASVGPKAEDVHEDYRERYAKWAGFVDAVAQDRTLVEGDPDKFAERVVEVVDDRGQGQGVLAKGTADGKVMRLLAGPDCYQMWGKKLEELKANYALMENIAVSTDFNEK